MLGAQHECVTGEHGVWVQATGWWSALRQSSWLPPCCHLWPSWLAIGEVPELFVPRSHLQPTYPLLLPTHLQYPLSLHCPDPFILPLSGLLIPPHPLPPSFPPCPAACQPGLPCVRPPLQGAARERDHGPHLPELQHRCGRGLHPRVRGDAAPAGAGGGEEAAGGVQPTGTAAHAVSGGTRMMVRRRGAK